MKHNTDSIVCDWRHSYRQSKDSIWCYDNEYINEYINESGSIAI